MNSSLSFNDKTVKICVTFIILFGPEKLKIVDKSSIRSIFGILAARASSSTFDYLWDLEKKGILSSNQVHEILSW